MEAGFLQARFPSPPGEIEATDITLVRTLGEVSRWRCRLDCGRNVRDVLSGDFAALLETGGLEVSFSASNGDDTVEIGRSGIVTCIRERDEALSSRIEIDAEVTGPDQNPDPFLSRWRVLSANTAAEMIRLFSHIADVPQAVLNDLDKIKFCTRTGQSAGVAIQAGQSDWEFFLTLLAHCRIINPEGPAELPLTLTSTPEFKKDAGRRWLVVPACQRVFERWNKTDERTVSLHSESNSDVSIEFGAAVASTRTNQSPEGVVPVTIHRVSRTEFSLSDWESWVGKTLPMVMKNTQGFVFKIEDRVYRPGSGDKLYWETSLFALPRNTVVAGPEKDKRTRPWVGRGEVVDASPNGPWISARLHGFDSGMDTVPVVINTPISGTNGRRGIHMVPHIGTEIAIAWSGRFDDPPISLGNIRSEGAELPAPSIWIEEAIEHHYTDSHVTNTGEISIDSELIVKVAESAKLEADGTKAELRGGTFYTGRS